MYGMKRAEGRKGRADGAYNFGGWGATPLYFGLAGTLLLIYSKPCGSTPRILFF
jgi:hypothetical protein